MDEKLLPSGEESKAGSPAAEDTSTTLQPQHLPGVPSPKQQQWGVVISIVIIVLMIIIGAFYAWGKRIAQNQIYPAPAASGQ
jgi:hypothetical protein